jgi:periplasmic divalent cation tolerance protein
MTDKRIVLTTTNGNKKDAQTLAQTLVERRLAACVNVIGPIMSVFRWQAKVEWEEEFLLVIKTTANGAAAIQSALSELHSYELPECVALPIEDGSEKYLDWIAQNVVR